MDLVGDIEMEDTVVSPISSKPLSKDSESRPEQGLQNKDQAGIDYPQFKLRFLLDGHKRAISCLKFSPGGTYLASACTYSGSGSICLTDSGGKLRIKPSKSGKQTQDNSSTRFKAMRKGSRMFPGPSMETM